MVTHVWSEFEVADASVDILVVGVVKMAVENLFGQSQRTVQPGLRQTMQIAAHIY